MAANSAALVRILTEQTRYVLRRARVVKSLPIRRDARPAFRVVRSAAENTYNWQAFLLCLRRDRLPPLRFRER
jgi:hypothetical protein